ncbi:MAG TPA: transglutaminase family protein [Ktedonobacteraceae bacterium]|nr:transglutaminase family protein [Ktedonobacteraceae bacterium]
MYYTVRHVTRFRYSAPITESVMEVHIQPRSDGFQHCLDFRLSTSPRSQIMSYRDNLGNRVHHFDIPNRHTHLTITAEALVEVAALPDLPQSLSPNAWDKLDALTAHDEYWDMLNPSHYVRSSDLLYDLIHELDVRRHDDPLTVLRELNTAIYETFDYVKQNTRVDSPIDDALRIRKGVCQDFAHIMIALARELGIPCRYVSGYLYHQSDKKDRSAEGATHAWVEALLPELGWVGFDPTNNTFAGERHIRIAIGRDYADVPPTHGIFRGTAESELAVTVKVTPTEEAGIDNDLLLVADWGPSEEYGYEEGSQWQQAQQQQ